MSKVRFATNATVPAEALDTIYVTQTPAGDDERYVVSLIVGYDEQRDNIVSPQQAVAAAVALTKDHEQHSTMWFVFDRLTGRKSFINQGSVQHLVEEMTP